MSPLCVRPQPDSEVAQAGRSLWRSSPPSWRTFSQTECSWRWRRTLTATSTMRRTGRPRAGSPGPTRGSSATGRGRGGTRSSPGEPPLTRGQWRAATNTSSVSFDSFFFIEQCFHSVIWKYLFWRSFAVISQCCHLVAAGTWRSYMRSSD